MTTQPFGENTKFKPRAMPECTSSGPRALLAFPQPSGRWDVTPARSTGHKVCCEAQSQCHPGPSSRRPEPAPVPQPAFPFWGRSPSPGGESSKAFRALLQLTQNPKPMSEPAAYGHSPCRDSAATTSPQTGTWVSGNGAWLRASEPRPTGTCCLRSPRRRRSLPGPTLTTATSLRPVPWHPSSLGVGRNLRGQEAQIAPGRAEPGRSKRRRSAPGSWAYERERPRAGHDGTGRGARKKRPSPLRSALGLGGPPTLIGRPSPARWLAAWARRRRAVRSGVCGAVCRPACGAGKDPENKQPLPCERSSSGLRQSLRRCGSAQTPKVRTRSRGRGGGWGSRGAGPGPGRTERVGSGEAAMAAALWPALLLRQAGNSAATAASGPGFRPPAVGRPLCPSFHRGKLGRRASGPLPGPRPHPRPQPDSKWGPGPCALGTEALKLEGRGVLDGGSIWRELTGRRPGGGERPLVWMQWGMGLGPSTGHVLG